jgi:ABC-2 type transport system permease protein
VTGRIPAQARMEIKLTLRRGESLLVTIGIPVGILAFFTFVDVLPHPGRAVDFLTPGVLALSVMSSAMTSLGIATGFERHAGVLRRLGTTPLRRSGLLSAKLIALLAVVALQTLVVAGVAYALGWDPAPVNGGWFSAAIVLLIGTGAFAGIGFLLAGRLRAETNLAVANALFLVFLLLGGIVVPLDRMPATVRDIARVLPAEPLVGALRLSFPMDYADVGFRPVITLAIWAFVTCTLAVRTFRWD